MAIYPGAIWRPTDKHGYGSFDTHSQEGVVVHSAEGSLAGALSVLDGPRQASWHFFLADTGHVYQHVDTDQIAWTNGAYDANKLWWGIECEGVAGEALTEPQFASLVTLILWLWATHQVGAFVRQETLWEHREMTRFGSAYTSCPSGRIPWVRLITELEEDMGMTAEEKSLVDTLFSQVAWLRAELGLPPQFDPTQEHESATVARLDWLTAHAEDANFHHSMEKIKDEVGDGGGLKRGDNVTLS